MRLSVPSATLLFALGALLLILLRPLMPIDETRYMAAAWEMHEGGSALVPHLNGQIYGHKPPLLFWLINLVWLAAGVADFAARLVAPAFAVASVALTGLLSLRLWPGLPHRAGVAALILATSPVFLLFGSTTMFDAMLCLATLLAMLAMWRAARHGGTANWLALGAAIALGVYSKGPVILLHVLLVALSMPVWRGSLGTRTGGWYRGVGLAVLVALGLVALWLVPALILGGDAYRVEVLWRQSAGRMSGSFAHQRPAWFFLALLPLFLWPFGWTMAGLRSLSPGRLWRESATRFLSVWFLGSFLAFSAISGKQAHYLLPELPALALLLAPGVSHRTWGPRDLWLALPLGALLVGLVLAGSGALPPLERMDYRLPLWAVGLGAGCLLAGIAGFLRLRSGVIALAALPLALVIGLHVAVSPLLFDRYDLAPIGHALAPYRDKGIAVTDTTYHAQLNYAARLNQPVFQAVGPGALAAWTRSHPGGVVLDQSGDAPDGMRPIARFPYRSGQYTVFQSHEVGP